jgi:hypothetical protein
MSYDLQFCVRAGATAPTAGELEAYFRGRPSYQLLQGSQAFYSNEDTGVYFTFDLGVSAEEAGEAEAAPPQDGLQAIPLSFNVNYMRPSIFGLEAESELTALVERFGLSVDDPQVHGMGRGAYSPAGFLAGWNAGNELGYRAMVAQVKQQAGSEGDLLDMVLPAAELERCWRWNLQRNDLQRELGDDVFVPRVSFLHRDGAIKSFVVWGDAMAVALPDVDYLMLVRQQLAPRRLFLFKPQDMAIARFSDLAPLLPLSTPVAAPVPHRVFRWATPPAAAQEFFTARTPFRGGQVGVPVDKVLDAELMRKALDAPPLKEMTFGPQS